MKENIPQFDFSKQEDQEKFDKLSQEQKDAHIENAQEDVVVVELKNLLENGDIDKVQELLGRHEVSEEKLQEVVLERLIVSFRKGRIYDAIKITQNFPISQEKLEEAAFEGLTVSLRNSYVDMAITIKKNFSISQETLQKAAFEGAVANFRRGYVDIAIKITQNFPISQEKLEEAAFEGLTVSLRNSYISIARKITQNFPISQEKLEEATLKGIVTNLKNGLVDDVIKIKENFPISQEKLNSPEVQKAVFEGIVVNLKKGYVDMAITIKENFPISEEKLEEATLKGIVVNLKKGYVDIVIKTKENFPMSEEKLNSPELQKATFKVINTILENEDYEIEDIKQILNLVGKQSLIDIAKFEQIITQKIEEITQFLQSKPEIEQEKIDTLKQSCEKSLYLQIELLNKDFVDDFKKNIEKNPLLLDALIDNPKFGPRLLATYEEFDKTSKKKIRKILEWSEQIQKEYPEIEKGSLEWRQKMQECINQYAKNPKTIEEMKKNGIDTQTWFEYDEVKELTLGTNKQEDISIARLIERPFDRIIGETIPEYISIIREEIEPYKKELQEIKIEINAVTSQKRIDLEQKLSNMKKALEQADNPRKQQGIKKGIENLESQLSRKKEILYLTKLYGTIDALNNVVEKAKSLQEELKEKENNPKDAIRLKKELYTEYKVLYMRFEKLRKEFEQYTIQFFKSHGNAVVQSVNTQTAEMLNHLSTDNLDMRSYFEDDTIEEKLKSIQPATLSLWNRDSDTDLYLGNYSPCCISMEGGAGWDSSESAIADYFTDSAIHVLNLTDPNTKEPFMSAWLYIGVDAKNNKALVIDNIESQAKRTDSYHDEIWNNVRDYVVELASKIGVDKVVMGTENNDIEPYSKDEKIDDPIGEFWKIGKVNGKRPDGYYLESEDENVWLLWEKESK